MYNPDICTIQSTGDLLCLKDDEELYVDEEKTNKILEIKMNGKKPTEGTLYFTNGKITTGENIKYNDLYYTIVNEVVSKGSKEKTDITVAVISNIKTYVGNITGICEIQNITSIKCNDEIKTIQQAGKKASDGIISFQNGEIKSYKNLKIEGKYYHNKNGEKSETDEKQYLCTRVSDADMSGTVTKGDKYTCKVNEDNTYNFYVLSQDKENISLIVERNICKNGTIATTSSCNVLWYKEDNNVNGPTAAYEALESISNNWINVPLMNYNYSDEGNNYGKIETTEVDGILKTKIYKKDETLSKKTSGIDAIYINMRVRLPEASEVSNHVSGQNDYLYGYLKENKISGIDAYWLSSSHSGSTRYIWYVDYRGRATDGHYSDTARTGMGVRPVITVPMYDLSS